MQVNEVVVNGVTELSLVNDTVSEDTLLENVTAHDASGKQITGKVVTVPVDSELNAESENAIQNKAVFAGINNAVNGVKEYANGIISNPNLLDNWYFADPINQRGQTEYTTAGYTIDRWIIGGNSSVSKYNINEHKLTSEGLVSTYAFLCNYLEKPAALAGKTATFSVLADGECSDWIIQMWRTRDNSTAAVATSGDWSGGPFKSITFDFPADVLPTDRYRLLIQTRYTLQPYAAKLELGSIQTLAHKDTDGNWVLNDPPPNPATELAKCQRHAFRLDPYIRYIASTMFPDGIDFFIPTPVNMRITPTVDLSNFVIRDINHKIVEGFTFTSILTLGSNGFVVRTNKTAHGLTWACLDIKDKTKIMIPSADL